MISLLKKKKEKKRHTGREKKWVIAILTFRLSVIFSKMYNVLCLLRLGRTGVYIIIEMGTSCYLHSHTLWRAFFLISTYHFCTATDQLFKKCISYLIYCFTQIEGLLFYSFNPSGPVGFTWMVDLSLSK